MYRPAVGSLVRPRRGRAPSVAVALVVALALAMPTVAAAATLTNAWRAKVGTAGANGTATISAYAGGSGSIVLKLAKLRASTSYTVVVYKGTCSNVGTTVIKVGSIRTGPSGAAARTTSLSASHVNAIKAATKGTGKVAIRISSGTSVKCGLFAPLGVPPSVAAKVTVGRSPSGVAIDPTGVWVTNWWDNTLSRINPDTNTVLSVVPVDFTATQGAEAIGSGAGSLWVTATDQDSNGDWVPGVVKRINPASGATLATIPVGKVPLDIDVSPGAVWVANADSDSVMRIDPATNQVVATIAIPDATGVTVGLGAVWVVGATGQVTRIDPSTNQIVTAIATQPTGGSIATGSGAVWVTNPGSEGQADGSLTRIDPATNQVVAKTQLGSNPQEVVVVGTNVWIGMLGESTVVRVSGTTNAVLNRVAVSAEVYAIAAAADVVWAVHNLPTPVGATEPPVGAVSRITASAPIASVTPAPSPSPTPTPTPTPSAGGLLIVGPYFFLALPAGWSDTTVGSAIRAHGPGPFESIGTRTEPTSLSLDGVSAQVLASIKSQAGVDPEQTEAITVGGSPARLMTYHFVSQGVTVHQLTSICVRNGRAYEISYANVAGTESADRALFLTVLGSFTFLSAAGY